MFKPTFADVRRDLVSRLYQIAYTLETLRGGAGSDFLRLDAAPPLDWPSVDDYDLGLLHLDGAVASLYRYASLGEHDGEATVEPAIEVESHLGQLRLMHKWSSSEVVDATSRWLEGELGIVFGEPWLGRLLQVVDARCALDTGLALQLEQVAALADIDDRTVRNALHLKGASRLHARRRADGGLAVEADEALRWLMRRPGFAPTTWAGAEAGQRSDAAAVEPGKLPAFLRARLDELFPDHPDIQQLRAHSSGRRGEGPDRVPGSGLATACERLGWRAERLEQVLAGQGDPLSPLELARLSQVLQWDRRWLERQVHGEPDASASPGATPLHHIFDEAAGRVTVMLSAAGIANGYLDIPTRYAERLFPPDAFGGRAGDALGSPVTLVVEGEAFESDIRRQSKAMTSPRKRFNGWFRRCRAEPGDQVRIERDGERRFSLRFVPATARP